MNSHRIHHQALARRWMAAMVFFFIHCSFFIGSASAQLRVEYFFDEDPGLGKAAWMNANTDAEGNFSFQPSTDGLSPGNHLFGFRAYLADDDNGSRHYGPTITQQVFVPESEDWATISRVEYFWDEDPGRGKATAIAIAPGSSVNLDAIEISTESLTPGTHLLGLRAFGSMGWGPTLTQQVYVAATTPEATAVSRLEYFWDEDPGFGNGTPLNIAPDQEVSVDNMEISTEGLSSGDHQLYVRAYGYTGWGPTIQLAVRVQPDESEFVVNGAEYFWDEDPGFGKGTPIAIADGQEVSTVGLGLSVDGLSVGEHQLFVRYRSPQGWSPTLATDVLNISETDLKVCTAEYFWNEDPGFGHGTPIALTPSDTVNLSNFNIPSSSVHGDATLFIRYRGPFGWSPTVAHAIMVDAEGSYTLNANAETSLETRNYQSLADAVSDFADRGVGNNITLNLPTTDTDYHLDATSDDILAQLMAITESIGRISTPREGKSIGFKAAEGSGNTLTVTTTAEGLNTVQAFFAHTWLENITLTINGDVYDFSSWAITPHSEEVCSGVETMPVSISIPITGMTIEITPQPYDGHSLSGFYADQASALPAMMIVNSSTILDSVAYRMVLKDEQGAEVSIYNYYIYVRPLVGNQQFSGMLPAKESCLDPGITTLKWNAVPAAEHYRLVVTDADGVMPDGFPIETTTTSYKLSVESGHHYTWQVMAIGPCDELPSPTMTLEGRLLPDLTVTDVTLPEVAEAGNTITVRATISNQGEGATTEEQWVDRLSYIIDSNDFGAAVQAAEVRHKGNITTGDSYDVTFTMNVPYLEAGTLRVFVETDASASVMESDDDNNRTLSTTAATLQPFYMNVDDLAALRKLYIDFDGDQWNGIPWNTASELIAEDNWSGVAFDTEGRVTAINLQGRGLKGTLDAENIEVMQSLTKLNLSQNSIDAMTGPLPSTVTNVSLGCQDIEACVSLSGILGLSYDLTALLPNVTTYNAANHTFAFDGYFQMKNDQGGNSQSWRMNVGDGTLQQVANPTVIYNEESGHQVRMRVYNGNVWNDMQVIIDYDDGDANLDGLCNVADLQHLINYAVNDTHTRVFFNFKTADLQPDGSANVLDVVRLVNLLLAVDNENTTSRHRRIARQPVNSETEAKLFLRGQELVLVTNRPVAAFDISLRTSAGAEVQWMPDDGSWMLSQHTSETSTHAIAYSLNGRTLPVGETVVARINNGNVTLGNVMLVDAEAHEVSVATNGTTTSVGTANAINDGHLDIYSVEGIKRDVDPRHKGLRIVNGKKRMVK